MLLKMIYQIEYIQHDEWNVTCTNSTPGPNKTYNSAEWLGFYKVSDSNTLAHLLRGYIAVIMVVTLNTVVCTRQKYKRHLKGRSLAREEIIGTRSGRDGLINKQFRACVPEHPKDILGWKSAGITSSL
ncbi:piezo-type mechanosensitive ion channel component-like [Diaphorina citri]|uniref:Piezo-type mechanosensitive ion channel component-like n=1 Tax=Diaphorina citri TaxID=121845 RepID=A0A1S3DAU7_DIACI|nr:piezo-type mechanosensitive ion channel component-like [Diaphorina citri]